MSTKSQDIIEIAYSRVGITEYPPNSNNVDANTYYYGHPVSGSAYPWCVTEVVYVFHLASAEALVKKTASTSDMAQWFLNQGRFFSSYPQAGDLIIFNFNRPDKIGDHIGMVAECSMSGSKITKLITIEGNTGSGNDANGGQVQKRNRLGILGNVVGFCRPKYADGKPIRRTLVKYGSKGADVYYMQMRLSSKGYSIGAIDGQAGSKTITALKQFQADNGLVVDGECGNNTWSKLI